MMNFFRLLKDIFSGTIKINLTGEEAETKKPWGREVLLISDRYVVKILEIEKGGMTSVQYHEQKHETILILSGIVDLILEDRKEELKAGDYRIIEPGMIHRMIGKTSAVYLECSTNELDDVVRLADNYGRLL